MSNHKLVTSKRNTRRPPFAFLVKEWASAGQMLFFHFFFSTWVVISGGVRSRKQIGKRSSLQLWSLLALNRQKSKGWGASYWSMPQMGCCENHSQPAAQGSWRNDVLRDLPAIVWMHRTWNGTKEKQEWLDSMFWSLAWVRQQRQENWKVKLFCKF